MSGSSDRTTVRVRIEGRVQGVGYRYWVLGEAEGLDLDGWVRNRRDGSVEAVFAGPAAVVAAMLKRCRTGPPMARVTTVLESPEPGSVAPGFRAESTV